MLTSVRLSLAKAVSIALMACATSCFAAPAGASESNDVLTLPTDDPARWVVDTTHLGTNQVEIAYDAADQAAILTPTWSAEDRTATDPAIRNVETSKLYLFQLVPRSDCTQSESAFEINVPAAYLKEGRLGVMFSLQGDQRDDYLFNGKAFTMDDFAGAEGGYRKVVVKASDFTEPEVKRRGIERIGFTLFRNSSIVSAPIRLRAISVRLNHEKIVPPTAEVPVTNPASHYIFSYNTPAEIARLETRISTESMDITRQLAPGGEGAALIPQWRAGQVPAGHPGNVYLCQSLGAPHDFSRFEVRYLMNIPAAYFSENMIELYLVIQAGESGQFVWSGSPRQLADFAAQAGQDMVLTLTPEDFAGGHGKKRNRIEYVGLQINRNGSVVTEPILLKRITIDLPE